MRCAEVIINPPAVKSDAVLRATVGQNSLATVRVIRGTKPAISDAINPASNTVAVAGPVPAHGVALGDVQCVRHEGEALPYGDIPLPRRESLARRRERARSRCWPGVASDEPINAKIVTKAAMNKSKETTVRNRRQTNMLLGFVLTEVPINRPEHISSSNRR